RDRPIAETRPHVSTPVRLVAFAGPALDRAARTQPIRRKNRQWNLAPARINPLAEAKPLLLILLPRNSISLPLENASSYLPAVRLHTRPVPHRAGRQPVALDTHHATLGASRCASSHAATSRASQTRRRPTRMAGAKRPSWRSHRTVRTEMRSRSATSSIVSSSIMSLRTVMLPSQVPKPRRRARPVLGAGLR